MPKTTWVIEEYTSTGELTERLFAVHPAYVSGKMQQFLARKQRNRHIILTPMRGVGYDQIVAAFISYSGY